MVGARGNRDTQSLFLEPELVEVVNRCDPSYTVFIINVFTVRH